MKKSELKGSSFTFSVLHLVDNDLRAMQQTLLEKIDQAPSFFEGAPLVVDISQVSSPIDFYRLKSYIEETGMVVVGISGCKKNHVRQAARKAGLAIVNPATTSIQQPNIQPNVKEQSAPLPTKIITAPIRSGQQIYAKNSDLVILSHVSAGAEIIADGSIHIYGILRGRAIAGACGQKNAYIFCQNLQSELLSIAGTYWLSETIPDQFIERPVKVSLHNDTLKVDPLTF